MGNLSGNPCVDNRINPIDLHNQLFRLTFSIEFGDLFKESANCKELNLINSQFTYARFSHHLALTPARANMV